MAREFIDTRSPKGRAAARVGVGARRDRNRAFSPRERFARPNTDLSSMLETNLPAEDFRRVQRALNNQDNALRESYAQLHECRARLKKQQSFRSHPDTPPIQKEVHGGYEQISDVADRRTDDQRTIQDLRTEKVSNDSRVELLGQLLEAGYKVLAEKNQEAEDLIKEVSTLHNSAAQKEDAISNLNARLLAMTLAPPQQWMALALESQASRNLAHVQCLTGDLSQRDSELVTTRDRIRTLTTENARLQTEALEAKEKISRLELTAETANKQAADSKRIFQEQQLLMKRLVDANARLSA